MVMCENELKAKSLEFQKIIFENIEKVSVSDVAFKDYLVMFELKISGIKQGKVLIYYKPSKKTYSLKLNFQNAQTANALQLLWDKLNGQENYGAESGIYEIYADGSYLDGKTGYGAAIFLGGSIVAELSGPAKTTQFRQFAGELKAVIAALNWCAAHGVEKARVNYDYAGVEKFATGAWKAKNEVSEYYVNYLKKAPVEIEWRHIKSHTGNARNNMADALAKSACARQCADG